MGGRVQAMAPPLASPLLPLDPEVSKAGMKGEGNESKFLFRCLSKNGINKALLVHKMLIKLQSM